MPHALLFARARSIKHISELARFAVDARAPRGIFSRVALAHIKCFKALAKRRLRHFARKLARLATHFGLFFVAYLHDALAALGEPVWSAAAAETGSVAAAAAARKAAPANMLLIIHFAVRHVAERRRRARRWRNRVRCAAAVFVNVLNKRRARIAFFICGERALGVNVNVGRREADILASALF